MSKSPPAKRLLIEDGENSANAANELDEDNDNRSLSSCSTASFRSAFDATHKITRSTGKFHLLIAVTGSVAAMKLPELIGELYRLSPIDKLVIKVMTTESAKNFFDSRLMQETVYDDKDEWNMWKQRGDPVLHIELRKWADILLVAPLDANSMAKVAHGICDNLVTSVIRAWDQDKPLYFAPAMNTCMWNSPLTYQHLKTLKELLLYREIPPIEKELICGDKGYGAMASLQMIASIIASEVKNKFAFYSVS
uniref:Flavoprotein domain-containing protein n=1 Tax=Ditylenchus dipsaci TaxID=166011 RepID=A0A915D790_9BILA